jgi:hypothetical protein
MACRDVQACIPAPHDDICLDVPFTSINTSGAWGLSSQQGPVEEVVDVFMTCPS